MNPRVLLAACLLDALAGDPEWLPHPVRLIGAAVQRGESALFPAERNPADEFLRGTLLTATVVAGSYAGTRLLLQAAYRISRGFGPLVEICLAATCIAARNLHDEAAAVLALLERGDLPAARKRLSRIVGRDTEHLDASEITRALLETLAESTGDGIVSPLFYLALGGLPAAMAFKAVSTLDSMIGHHGERYEYFGKAAARLDDAANFVPSRIAAACLAGAAALHPAADACEALRTSWREGSHHKSPNAGWPEAAIAGALRVRLGGTNTYAGEAIETPVLGSEFHAPQLPHARKGLRITCIAAVLAASTALVLAAATHTRRASR